MLPRPSYYGLQLRMLSCRMLLTALAARASSLVAPVAGLGLG